MGRPMRLELTREVVLVKLATHNTNQGALLPKQCALFMQNFSYLYFYFTLSLSLCLSLSLYIYIYIYIIHHHVVPQARISLILSRHPSLLFIASGSSSGVHPVSSQSCCMYVRAGLLLLLGHMWGSIEVNHL